MLFQLLSDYRAIIVDRWVDSVLDTYSADGSAIFKKQKDRFANPVGYNVRQGLLELYNLLLGGEEIHLPGTTIESLIKVRAVQEFSPSAAVSFIFTLKQLVRESSLREKIDVSQADWLLFESRLDALALKVFDLYMSCRERLHQIRVRELESGTHILTDGTKCSPAMLRRSPTKIETYRN